MEGTIEQHGGRLMVNINGSVKPVDAKKFIPGDKITIENNEAKLKYRIAQPALGVIKEINDGKIKLFFPQFGISCPYEARIKASKVYELDNKEIILGDRLILWLKSNGKIKVIKKYSSEAKYDYQCILDLYKMVDKTNIISLQKGQHFYTNNDMINHEDLYTFTIDPENSVDFDDAISVDYDNKLIYVHIVDIAAEETRKLIKDKNLEERCLTLYLANEHTEHLLEENLASKVLSLIKGEKRRVITTKMKVDGNKVISYDIYPSSIIVKERYNYNQINKILEEGNNLILNWLNSISKERSSNLAYNINVPATVLSIDKSNGNTINLILESTNDDGHSLVATLMIMCNLVISKHLANNGVLLPNRFHASLKGFDLTKIKEIDDPYANSFMIIKKFARAEYSIDERGHFGLGLTDYVHFTSPMRRYADVLVHQLLAGYKINKDDLDKEVEYINYRARIVNTLSELYYQWKIINWLENNNKSYECYILDVKAVGVIWYIPDISVNGFCHVSNILPKGFWKLKGKDLSCGLMKITVGDKAKCTILNFDKITDQINVTISIIH